MKKMARESSCCWVRYYNWARISTASVTAYFTTIGLGERTRISLLQSPSYMKDRLSRFLWKNANEPQIKKKKKIKKKLSLFIHFVCGEKVKISLTLMWKYCIEIINILSVLISILCDFGNYYHTRENSAFYNHFNTALMRSGIKMKKKKNARR